MSESEPLYDKLEAGIGYVFRDRALLRMAMTHSSARDKERPCNERLEFLGDAIVGLTTSEYLFLHFPDLEEGTLSMMKSVLVSAKTLSKAARDLDLEPHIVLGKGLARRKHLPSSILCNAFEALVASIHLDGGKEAAPALVLRFLIPEIEQILRDEYEKNYKSLLQDYAQKQIAAVPHYRVVDEVGPDHKKMFQIVVEVGTQSFGPAWGPSKKEAEQEAARLALTDLGLLSKP